MAASYPGLVASGLDDLGRFDPFELFAGDSDVVTDQGQAADATAIEQFQVLTYDHNGRLVPWLGTGFYATGTLTFGGVPTALDTLTINGHVITFVNGAPGANEVRRDGGATATTIAQAVLAMINADPDDYEVSASGASTVLTLTAVDQGVAGNALTIAKSGTYPSLSGATLSGASEETAESVPVGWVVAIAAQAVPIATPGAKLPIYTAGIFNHEKLVWPVGITTLAQRKLAMAGTPLGCRALL